MSLKNIFDVIAMDQLHISTIADKLYNEYFQQSDCVNDFKVFSTIRYDPNISRKFPKSVSDITVDNFFLLPEHIHRLQFTVDFFNYTNLKKDTLDFDLQLITSKLIQAIDHSQCPVDKSLRLRLVSDLNGEITVEIYDTIERPNLMIGFSEVPQDDIYDVYIDTTQIMMSPFTSFKTTARDHYNAARAKLPAEKTGKEEIIFANKQGFLMEGSITNVYIKRGDKWVTPTLDSGCLCGVTRHMLLTKHYVEEQPVLLQDLTIGDDVLLSNGLIGVVRGKIRGFK